MIKKTMAITSIAILIAAVSVAATITMVQAHPDVDTKATFGLVLGVANPLAGGDLSDHLYSEVATSDPGTVLNTPGGSLAIGNFDAAEPIFQGGGAAPGPLIPGSPFTVHAGGIPITTPFNAVVGHEEATFLFTAPNPGQNYFLGTTISDMDDFFLTLDAAMLIPAPETVFVSVNGVNLTTPVTAVPSGGADQTITTAHGVVKALPAGGLVVGFNEIFTWDPAGLPTVLAPVCGNIGTPLPCIGDETGIRVEQITVDQASQSHGYWKTHEPETLALLPKTIGDLDVDTSAEAFDVLSAKGHGNAHNKLATELLAALLNDMNGSTCTFPAGDAAAAQAILDAADYTGSDSTPKPRGADKTTANTLKDSLEDYNTNTVC
jgi:hypothetical protein